MPLFYHAYVFLSSRFWSQLKRWTRPIFAHLYQVLFAVPSSLIGCGWIRFFRHPLFFNTPLLPENLSRFRFRVFLPCFLFYFPCGTQMHGKQSEHSRIGNKSPVNSPKHKAFPQGRWIFNQIPPALPQKFYHIIKHVGNLRKKFIK